MDLGATICRPRNPGCEECPVEDWCIDPRVYEPPPRQSAYEGSVRQARAAILKSLAEHGPSTQESIAASTGLDPATLAVAVDALERESTLVRTADLVSLAPD